MERVRQVSLGPGACGGRGAIINGAAMNIGVQVSFLIVAFSGYLPRSGIVGSFGSSIFVFVFF